MSPRGRSRAVRDFVLSLPETAEGQHGGRPAYRVGRRLIVVIQPGEDEVLLWVDANEREALIAEVPEAFTEIQTKQGGVVENWITADVALSGFDLLQEVIEDAWRAHAPKRALTELEHRRASEGTLPSRRGS